MAINPNINLQEMQDALGAKSSAPKPVEMESIQEPTIDVSGGSTALEIGGPLSPSKKRKDDSVSYSSTTPTLNEYFGDLLESSDGTGTVPLAEIVHRGNELSPNINNQIISESSSLLSKNVTSPAPVGSSPIVFKNDRIEPEPKASELEPALVPTTSGDFAASTVTGSEEFSAMSPTAQKAALGVMRAAPGAYLSIGSGRASPQDVAADLGLSLLGSPVSYTDPTGIIGNFTNVSSVPNTLDAISAGLRTVDMVSSMVEKYNSYANFESIIEDISTNISETVKGVTSVFTDPKGAINAFGNWIEWGGQDPNVRSFELPSGKVSFVFDRETNMISTPGMIQALTSMGKLGSFFNLAQMAMHKQGYTEEVSERANLMSDAFSGVGLQYGATTGYSTLDGYGVVDINLNNINPEWSNQFALSDLPEDKTIGQLTAQDFDRATVIQDHAYEYLDDPQDKGEMLKARQDALKDTAKAMGYDPNNTTVEDMNRELGKNTLEPNERMLSLLDRQFQERYKTSIYDLIAPEWPERNRIGTGLWSAIAQFDKQQKLNIVDKTRNAMLMEHRGISQEDFEKGKKLSELIGFPVMHSKRGIDEEFKSALERTGGYEAGGYNDPTGNVSDRAMDLANATMYERGTITYNTQQDTKDLETSKNIVQKALELGLTVQELHNYAKQDGRSISELAGDMGVVGALDEAAADWGSKPTESELDAAQAALDQAQEQANIEAALNEIDDLEYEDVAPEDIDQMEDAAADESFDEAEEDSPEDAL